MGKSLTFSILLVASICYLSSALEIDLNSSNGQVPGVVFEPAESTVDSVQVQPVENIEDDDDTEQASLLDIDTQQGHENESGRKARQFYGGGGYGGRGFYGGGFYPRPYYGGGGFYGRRFGYGGYGGYRGGFRYYG